MDILKNILLKICVMALVIVITLWLVITLPIYVMICLFRIAIIDYTNDESQRTKFAKKLVNWGLDLVVLPYKIFGCNNFAEYLEWINQNND